MIAKKEQTAMIRFWFDLIVILLGFCAVALLFWRIPHLPRTSATKPLKLTIIIPARNEEQTLPLLLQDLKRQRYVPHEIIVVDDDSDDKTASIARENGATVLSLHNKPSDWVGKSWACQQGARAATGDSLLFLDADVRLSAEGLGRIVAAHEATGVISVQPYHAAQRWYEQNALVFNLVQIGANGSALPRRADLGLFGPVILLSRADYDQIGGHESVKSAIVEDMALADQLRRAGIPFQIFVGDADVSFRMYPAGICSLWQGFSKNLATGAAKTPAWLFFLVVLFIASITSVPLNLSYALAGGSPLVWLYAALY
ncbi:MAG: glycosyltransferase, partial [Clostridia bacterium]|nr:glycosyltransferase [Clostridia bacterium]